MRKYHICGIIWYIAIGPCNGKKVVCNEIIQPAIDNVNEVRIMNMNYVS